MGIFDSILNQVSGELGGMSGQQSGLAGSVIGMINSQPGGLAGLVQTCRDKGLGGAVSSWIGTGANQAISPEQIQQVLGNQRLQEFASQHGISMEQVCAHLTQILPVVVDKLTPNGVVPEGGTAGGLADSLKNLMGGGRSS
jgi:uncharacterized protein YidB (DUF937 family)